MHLGRERPPENWAQDCDRGVAEGDAHAPDVAFPAADSRADTAPNPQTAKDIAESAAPSA
jgi:hypothetical protein